MTASDASHKTTKHYMVTLSNIIEERNLLLACNQVMSNDGAPGVDGMNAEDLFKYLVNNWKELQWSVLEGKYRPEAVRRVEIPKPNGGVRNLGIPTVVDRMLQQAIAQELDKEYDATFSATSYGFRKGRSAHDALDKATEYLNSGLTYIVEIDLEKFFDGVNHDKLMYLLSKRISDKGVLRLIRRYLESGVMENGVVRRNEEGTPQGGNLSPILSNIMLDELDKELEQRGHKFVRYADDISIFAGSQRAAERILESVTEWLEKRLKLKVNREKSGIRRPSKGNLLGFGFWHAKEGEIRPRVSEKSYTRLKEKLKRFTSRSWSVSMETRLMKINQLTRGWVNYFAKADARKRLERIDEWLQARLRICFWKQWKRVRTCIANLQKLGVSAQKAYEWGNTRRSYWRTAHSPILQTTITNERLKQKGYVSTLETYTLRRKTLMNRRDPDTSRDVRWCERTKVNHATFADSAGINGGLTFSYSIIGKALYFSLPFFPWYTGAVLPLVAAVDAPFDAVHPRLRHAVEIEEDLAGVGAIFSAQPVDLFVVAVRRLGVVRPQHLVEGVFCPVQPSTARKQASMGH